LAIELPRFTDVDPAFKRFVEQGGRAVYEPRDEPWGMRSSMIADPEGNLIEIGSWNKK
jgi:lactoylglutathione lyase